MQLRVQNVQALQTLNSETKTLQRKLQQQLRELLTLTTQEGELFSSVKDKDNDSDPSNHGTSSNSSGNHVSPFRASLLSLLADFIDGSCNELRAELQTTSSVEGTASALKTALLDYNEKNKPTYGLKRSVSLESNWSWPGEEVEGNEATDDAVSDIGGVSLHSLSLYGGELGGPGIAVLAGSGATAAASLSQKDKDNKDKEHTMSPSKRSSILTPETVGLGPNTSLPTYHLPSKARKVVRSVLVIALHKHLGWMADLRGEKAKVVPVVKTEKMTEKSKTFEQNTHDASIGQGIGATKVPTGGNQEEEHSDIDIDLNEKTDIDEDERVDDDMKSCEDKGSSEEDTSEPVSPGVEQGDGVGETKEGESDTPVGVEELPGFDAKTAVDFDKPDGSSVTGEIGDEAEEEEEVDEEVTAGVRIALLPDFRSRALWLSALLDTEGVRMMVTSELRARLGEIIETNLVAAAGLAADSCSKDSIVSESILVAATVAVAGSVADKFCSKVSRGVGAAGAASLEMSQ